ncbi:hypothetical protein CTAYLR_009394 [Chrysophaeum taylorii]|uniref:Uncharacterized protein n=1 Tax=Chrysophaeum taylorii TaxID=2483200 RepID=A0AAD7UKF5_9STRA|nr:hypothetical protein CTAYLR_009394 [Chrysophaeum taylorii]
MAAAAAAEVAASYHDQYVRRRHLASQQAEEIQDVVGGSSKKESTAEIPTKGPSTVRKPWRWYQQQIWRARRGKSRPTKFTLGEAMVRFGWKDKTVRVVGKFVTEISEIPTTTSASTLLASNNSIASLGDIGQLGMLRTLSLANNCIEYLEDLDPLSLLPALECLSLDGNAVCWVPGYRSYALSVARGLRRLDGKPVEDSELRTAGAIVRRDLATYRELAAREDAERALSVFSRLGPVHLDLMDFFSIEAPPRDLDLMQRDAARHLALSIAARRGRQPTTDDVLEPLANILQRAYHQALAACEISLSPGRTQPLRLLLRTKLQLDQLELRDTLPPQQTDPDLLEARNHHAEDEDIPLPAAGTPPPRSPVVATDRRVGRRANLTVDDTPDDDQNEREEVSASYLRPSSAVEVARAALRDGASVRLERSAESLEVLAQRAAAWTRHPGGGVSFESTTYDDENEEPTTIAGLQARVVRTRRQTRKLRELSVGLERRLEEGERMRREMESWEPENDALADGEVLARLEPRFGEARARKAARLLAEKTRAAKLAAVVSKADESAAREADARGRAAEIARTVETRRTSLDMWRSRARAATQSLEAARAASAVAMARRARALVELGDRTRGPFSCDSSSSSSSDDDLPSDSRELDAFLRLAKTAGGSNKMTYPLLARRVFSHWVHTTRVVRRARASRMRATISRWRDSVIFFKNWRALRDRRRLSSTRAALIILRRHARRRRRHQASTAAELVAVVDAALRKRDARLAVRTWAIVVARRPPRQGSTTLAKVPLPRRKKCAANSWWVNVRLARVGLQAIALEAARRKRLLSAAYGAVRVDAETRRARRSLAKWRRLTCLAKAMRLLEDGRQQRGVAFDAWRRWSVEIERERAKVAKALEWYFRTLLSKFLTLWRRIAKRARARRRFRDVCDTAAHGRLKIETELRLTQLNRDKARRDLVSEWATEKRRCWLARTTRAWAAAAWRTKMGRWRLAVLLRLKGRAQLFVAYSRWAAAASDATKRHLAARAEILRDAIASNNAQRQKANRVVAEHAASSRRLALLSRQLEASLADLSATNAATRAARLESSLANRELADATRLTEARARRTIQASADLRRLNSRLAQAEKAEREGSARILRDAKRDLDVATEARMRNVDNARDARLDEAAANKDQVKGVLEGTTVVREQISEAQARARELKLEVCQLEERKTRLTESRRRLELHLRSATKAHSKTLARLRRDFNAMSAELEVDEKATAQIARVVGASLADLDETPLGDGPPLPKVVAAAAAAAAHSGSPSDTTRTMAASMAPQAESAGVEA